MNRPARAAIRTAVVAVHKALVRWPPTQLQTESTATDTQRPPGSLVPHAFYLQMHESVICPVVDCSIIRKTQQTSRFSI